MNTIKEETQIKEAEKAEYNKLFWEVAGSWQSEETGTELANQLYEDRNDYSREIEYR